MFLSRRATQEEYMDTPGLPESEVAEYFRELARVNRLFQWSDPFKRILPRWLGLGDGRPLHIQARKGPLTDATDAASATSARHRAAR